MWGDALCFDSWICLCHYYFSSLYLVLLHWFCASLLFRPSLPCCGIFNLKDCGSQLAALLDASFDCMSADVMRLSSNRYLIRFKDEEPLHTLRQVLKWSRGSPDDLLLELPFKIVIFKVQNGICVVF